MRDAGEKKGAKVETNRGKMADKCQKRMEVVEMMEKVGKMVKTNGTSVENDGQSVKSDGTGVET